MRSITVSRRAAVAAALAACCSVPRGPAFAEIRIPEIPTVDIPSIKEIEERIEADRAKDAAMRDAAIKPNRFGKLEPEPEAAPRKLETDGFNGQRGMDALGRLAPEYEGDTRERYSNPYARRLGEVAKEAGKRDMLTPGKVDIPVYRDGYFSVKPNNIFCDDDGRNCKFKGAMPGTASAKEYVPYEVPYEQTAEYRREQFAEENRKKREANLAKAAAKKAALEAAAGS